MATRPKLLISDEAMAGLSSSEVDEVLAMADRVLVMARGRLTAEFTAANVTEEALVRASASDSVLEAQ